MLNVLVSRLPDTVDVDGVEYEINTDFRSCLRVILAFEDDTLTGLEKQMILVANLFPEMPDNLAGAVESGVRFLNGGESGEKDDSPRLTSFSKDANFIFSAFRQTHGIDLETAEMHWWKFLALFMDLGSETTFCNLVSLRKRVKSGKASKEELKAARELGDVFEISEPRTPEEKRQENEFLRLVAEAKQRRNGSS